MRFIDVITTALEQIRVNKLRSFFTLLGIIVSVAFLVAVVAIISGMNAYVKENLASALIGANTPRVRKDTDPDRTVRRRRVEETASDPACEVRCERGDRDDPRKPMRSACSPAGPLPSPTLVWRDRDPGPT